MRGWGRVALAAIAAAVLAGCGAMRSGPPAVTGATQEGVASWYGPGFHGKRTANGEIYDQHDLTAAHPSLPLGTRVMVTNLATGRSVEVRVNDRGPFVGRRIIDLSYAAARAIDMVGPGTAHVRLEVLAPGGARVATRVAVRDVHTALPRATFVVQIAAFADRGAAERLRDSVGRHFDDAHVDPLDTDDGRYFRVRLGPYPQRRVAIARAELVSRLGHPAIIMEATGL